MQALQVRVETERAPSNSDVLVRAIAGQARMNDGKPIAGFLIRRRYHGDTFNLQHPSEFSPNWMEFIDVPPKQWIEVIKTKYPSWDGGSRYEESKPDSPRVQSLEDVSRKISSGDFDYSNGQPRRRGRPPKAKLVLE